jgi:asparagine synthase (glutamine-hydrolysing)
MCGILGGFVPNNLKPAQIESCLDTIRHRGPDDSGLYCAGGAFIGMRRLSIIDVVGGHQPIFNEDKQISVVLNGEIYNYLELILDLESKGHIFHTRSDTEVLVHLFEEHGTDLCQFLRGMFAFAILDARDNSIFIARDRFGKKPLYYLLSNEKLLFGSEIKAVKALAGVAALKVSINPQAIYDYLSLGVIPQPSTIYQEINTLPAGSWAQFKLGSLNIQKYWCLSYAPKLEISYADALEKTRALMSEAVRIRLRSDVPLGVFLSGGVDSSVIAYEAAKEIGTNLQTFTVRMGSSAFDESAVATQTAQALGIQNTILNLEVSPLDTLQKLVHQYDQPFSDSSAIPSLEISKLARQHVTVVLNGDGGDEVFAGYRRYQAVMQSGSFDWLPKSLARGASQILRPFAPDRRSMLGFAARFSTGLTLSAASRYFAWTTDMLLEADKKAIWRGGAVLPSERLVDSVLKNFKGLSPLDQQMGADVNINLLNDLLVKMDIATMAYSLEGRSPFLDHHVAEFAAQLPDSFKVAGQTKRVLRDAYRGRLSQDVLNGAKRGFEIPLEAWLNLELKQLLQDTLGANDARVNAWVEPAFVQSLLRGTLMRDRNWKYLVYALLILELWLRENDV